MAKISGIEPQQRNKNRVSVFVDGEYFGSLTAITCAQWGLSVGSILDEAQWADIQRQNEAQQAFDRALTYLERSARSREEIVRHLTDRGFEPAAIEPAMEKLDRYGYVNDKALAQALVRDRTAVRSSGRRQLEQTLYRRRIPKQIRDEVLGEISEQDEQDGVRRLLPQMLRRYAGEQDVRQKKRKIAAALQRRGYGWDVISPLLDSLGEDDFDQ
jgi:regulatory protein